MPDDAVEDPDGLLYRRFVDGAAQYRVDLGVVD